MEDPELEEIRRRRLAELQKEAEQRALAEEQMRRIEEQRAAILRGVLTPEARERLARVKMAHPDVARVVEDQLIALASSGRLDREIDDATLRQILRRLAPKKREIKIERI